ncbi:DCC-interacting protein 13-alpha [Amphibalanus amphitrite]|uniref:DCC-interacting protein 13-alpha n=1 Tax=Amphibalanus amphitrite TaxID=1232801 RepID=A0A6A4WIQ1_AMPAM|nr:DCC-interacting protein 13-alpha [Amphibalanus amphitrite]
MKGLWKCCQRLIVAQQEVTVSIRSLANHLRSYPQQSPLESNCETAPTLREFAQNIEEIGSWHHGLCTQLAESVAAPVHRYIDKELQEVFTVGQMYQTVTEDLDRTLSRYARASKKAKPDLETERLEAASEVYTSRKKFHQMSLLYYNKMNLLQYSRRMALVDPLLGFLQAYRSFFSMGNGSLNVPEMETFLSTVTAASAATQSELMSEMAESADLMDAIITQSEGQYSVEPDQDGSPRGEEPPAHIADYLFYKTRYMGVMSQWERVFVFTEGGNLLMCRRGEAAGCLLAELDHSTLCQPLPNEDRGSVFQISTSKKSVILQAMNDRQRDQWLAAIGHIVKTGGYVRRPSGSEKIGSPGAGSILSGVSQFFADKLQHHTTDGSRSRGADTPDSLSADAPIVFELPWSPDEQAAADVADAPPFAGQTFDARFLGSMEVQADRGHRLVSEVIRQIQTARAQHRLADAARCRLEVGLNELRVTEPGETGRLRALYPFHHISFWAPHLENDRLLGMITLTPGQALFCHVFETEVAGQQVCSALTHATTAAYRRHREADLLLQNVRREEEPQLTADGAALILPPAGPEETPPQEEEGEKETEGEEGDEKKGKETEELKKPAESEA